MLLLTSVVRVDPMRCCRFAETKVRQRATVKSSVRPLSFMLVHCHNRVWHLEHEVQIWMCGYCGRGDDGPAAALVGIVLVSRPECSSSWTLLLCRMCGRSCCFCFYKHRGCHVVTRFVVLDNSTVCASWVKFFNTAAEALHINGTWSVLSWCDCEEGCRCRIFFAWRANLTRV